MRKCASSPDRMHNTRAVCYSRRTMAERKEPTPEALAESSQRLEKLAEKAARIQREIDEHLQTLRRGAKTRDEEAALNLSPDDDASHSDEH